MRWGVGWGGGPGLYRVRWGRRRGSGGGLKGREGAWVWVKGFGVEQGGLEWWLVCGVEKRMG